MKAMQCEQESHGDWLATEHNSAVANNLKQKYGEQITIMMMMIIMMLTLRSYMYKVFTMLATSLIDWKEDDGNKIKTMVLKF